MDGHPCAASLRTFGLQQVDLFAQSKDTDHTVNNWVLRNHHKSAAFTRNGDNPTHELWPKRFTEPLQSWERKLEKRSSRYLVFVHVATKEAVWSNACWSPYWTQTDVASRKQIDDATNYEATKMAYQQHNPEICGASSANSLRVAGTGMSTGSALAYAAFNKLSDEENFHEALEAVSCYMDQHEIHNSTNNVFYHLLQRCIDEKDLATGRNLRCLIVRNGFDSDAFLGSHLVRMFTLFESLSEAKQVFSKIYEPNLFAWRAIISAHAKLGQNEQAIKLFHQMLKSNVDPNEHIYVAVLEACASIADLTHGRVIHAHILEHGLESHVFIGNTLIDMYAKCGNLHNACMVFDRLPTRDVVTWNAMIAGHGDNEHGLEALELFQQMQQDLVKPTKSTFLGVLKACSSMTDVEQGKQIHSHAMECGYELDLSVSSTLIDMYGKCGSLEDAKAIFDKLPKKDVITWNALIAGYSQQGLGQEALLLFQQMQKEGTEPNEMAFSCILKACSTVSAFDQGKQIHRQIMGRGLESNVFVGSALIDMYCKCGGFEDACIVFDRLPKRNVVTWSAMIAGHALYGNHKAALQYFHDMQQVGLKPNEVTFLCLLSAYSHLGLVDEGCLHFKLMREEHCIVPTIEHLNSMVDLLGHAGNLSEAEDLLESIPMAFNSVGWTSLLGSCRTHGNVDVGLRCFDRIVAMDSGKAAAYVLMSNIYARAGLQEDAEKVEDLRRCANAWKKPGKAYIEIDNEVHGFTVGDRTHPQIGEIYAKLKTIGTQMKKEGYVPRLDLVMDSISDDHKEDALCGHCEKLAIALGLLATPPGTTIRITKNLRMCADCHLATKIISKMELREIIITDAYCIHQFKDGACSCRDRY